MNEIQSCLVLAVLVPAVIMDLCIQKVKNWLIAAGLMLAAVFNIYEAGASGIPGYIAGVIFPAAMLFVLFLFRVLGAGDIKLFSVIGGFVGVKSVFLCIVASFVLGAFLALAKIIRNRNFISRLQYLAAYTTAYVKTKEIEPYYRSSDGTENIIHFSAAILGGYLLFMGGFF